jgi:hypothetical protein
MKTQITTPKGILATFEEEEIGPVPLDRVVESDREYGLKLLFSPDGKRLGYVLNEDGGQCAVLDGKRGAIHDHVDALRFGAGRHRSLYRAHKGDRCCVVVDSEETEWFEAVHWILLQFSEDGEHWAGVVVKDGLKRAVIDGKLEDMSQLRRFKWLMDDVGQWIIGAEEHGGAVGADLSWLDEEDAECEKALYRTTKEEAPRASTPAPHEPQYRQDPGYSDVDPAWVRRGYPAQREYGLASPYVVWWGRVFSPDGQMVAWVEANDEQSPGGLVKVHRLEPDGLIQIEPNGEPNYDCAIWPGVQFSPDSRHYAFAAHSDHGRIVVVDGEPGPAFDGIGESVFNPWRESYGSPSYYDHEAGAASELIPGWTRDSEHLVYVAERDGKKFVIVDGHEGPSWDAIAGYNGHYPLESSHDHEVHFDVDRRLRFAAVRDGMAYTVTMKLG